jgi:copper chaperone CopZ
LINKNIENVDGNNSVSISVEDLKDGLYFVTLQNGNQKLTKSFIKK